MDCALLPAIGVNIVLALLMRGDLVKPFRIARRVHDPDIVAAIGENESHIGIRKSLDLINGSPGCDMVRQGADGKDGDANPSARRAGRRS